MDHTYERIQSGRETRPEPLTAAPHMKVRLTKTIPCTAQSVPNDPSNRLNRAPATPLMLTPTVAWRRLCARTGSGVTRQTFYRWIRNGSLYSVRMGKRIFVPIERLDDLIKKCLTGEKL
jgi:excisionase family DNA binding protein